MGSKMPRSPSPPPEPSPPAPLPHPAPHPAPPVHPAPPPVHPAPPPVHPAPSLAPDTQELQINAILQGIAAENNSNARAKKKKRKVEKPPPVQPPLLPQISRKELADIKKHNLDVRTEVFRAVRRPGKDFTKLFEQLKQLKGGVDVKKEVIRDVINESLRFKRKALAKLLEDFLAGLEKNGSSASLNIKRINNTLYSNSNNHS